MEKTEILPGSALEAANAPGLQVQTLKGIEPLDAQLGADPVLTFPEAMREPLEIGKAESRLSAVLDGTKIPQLPEILATSGLPHTALLSGMQDDELAEIGPWLVELTEDAALLRAFFTKIGDEPTPWALWDADAGILLRSSADHPTLAGHLASLVMQKDRTGKTWFLRYWESGIAADYFTALSNASDRCRLFFSVTDTDWIEAILARDSVGDLWTRVVPDKALLADVLADPATSHLSQAEYQALRRAVLRPFARQLREEIAETHPDLIDDSAEEQSLTAILDSLLRLQGYGLLALPILRELTIQDLFLGFPFEDEDETGRLRDICHAKVDEDQKYDLICARIAELDVVEAERV